MATTASTVNQAMLVYSSKNARRLQRVADDVRWSSTYWPRIGPAGNSPYPSGGRLRSLSSIAIWRSS